MKFIKKLGLSILVANLALTGYGLANTNLAYATEAQQDETQTEEYKVQRQQLEYAVGDRANVVSSEAYVSYASESTKAAYEKAIADARALLQTEAPKQNQLAAATASINQARQAIKRDVSKVLARERLKKAIEDNKKTAASARYLLENAPKTVAKVKDVLIRKLQRSEELIKLAEAKLK